MIDLRKEFQQIMDDSGHAVLVQRSNRRIRCICWNEKYIEADSNCKRCLGEGWVSRIERHTVRRQSAIGIQYLPLSMKQSPMGQMNAGQKNFFMAFDSNPQRGDVIMEVGWKGHTPTHLISAYDITDVQDLRGDGGRVEYFVVSCVEKASDTKIRGYAVRRLGPVRNYEMLKK